MVQFQSGQVVATRTAAEKISPLVIMLALAKHLNGDWGDLCEADKTANDRALRDGDRLLSAYHAPDGTKFWIITEADRSCTTVLLPDDY
ncbi:MAG: hypothetical protein IJT94_15790 [Oscillibacter sp.]|nr:hypothetical protein [Oscillibacter sp.]